MPVFQYKAATASGEVVQGTLEGASRDRVVEKLHALGQIPIRVEQSTVQPPRKRRTLRLRGRRRGGKCESKGECCEHHGGVCEEAEGGASPVGARCPQNTSTRFPHRKGSPKRAFCKADSARPRRYTAGYGFSQRSIDGP